MICYASFFLFIVVLQTVLALWGSGMFNPSRGDHGTKSTPEPSKAFIQVRSLGYLGFLGGRGGLGVGSDLLMNKPINNEK